MSVLNANQLPSATGLDLGSSSQRWDAFIQALDVSTTATIAGALTVTGAQTFTGNATFQGNISVAGTSTLTGNVTAVGTVSIGGGTALATTNQTGTGSLVLATSPTISAPTVSGHPTVEGVTSTGATGTGKFVFDTAPTVSSPVINGTPSGTGIPTVTLKKGSGGGNYTTASTTYVRADSTNLNYAVTIPSGWKLMVSASGSAFTATGAVSMNVAIADGGSDNTGILVEHAMTASSTSAFMGWAIHWVITGDGASHTINLQYKTSNASDSATISNSSATIVPQMVCFLTPSN